MKAAYVDTSCLVAIAFGERGATALARRLAAFDDLLASNLLEAELRATFAREGITDEPDALAAITWILPDRPLRAEIVQVLEAGYMRAADCWHLATALYVAQDPGELTFLTLDARQRGVAKTLGFTL